MDMAKITQAFVEPQMCMLNASLGVGPPGHLVLRKVREGQLRQARHNEAEKCMKSHPL